MLRPDLTLLLFLIPRGQNRYESGSWQLHCSLSRPGAYLLLSLLSISTVGVSRYPIQPVLQPSCNLVSFRASILLLRRPSLQTSGPIPGPSQSVSGQVLRHTCSKRSLGQFSILILRSLRITRADGIMPGQNLSVVGHIRPAYSHSRLSSSIL